MSRKIFPAVDKGLSIHYNFTMKGGDDVNRADCRELRMSWNLPTDDVDLAYEILKRCEMGLPMPKLCVLLGLRPGDFHKGWKILHEVQKKYGVKIGKWLRGGSSWVLIKKDDGLISFYEAVFRYTKRMTTETVEPRPKQETSHPLEELKKQEVCTIADIVRLTGYTRQGARLLLDRWVEQGIAEIIDRGRPGVGGKLKFRVIA